MRFSGSSGMINRVMTGSHEDLIDFMMVIM